MMNITIDKDGSSTAPTIDSLASIVPPMLSTKMQNLLCVGRFLYPESLRLELQKLATVTIIKRGIRLSPPPPRQKHGY